MILTQEFEKPPVRVMTLATRARAHAQHSGYSVLADYLPGAIQLETPRLEPNSIAQRTVGAVLRRCTLTRWYRLSSASLEWQAWRQFRDFEGVVHLMWADLDLGFLDLIRDKRRHRLCCTFHCCPDTLPEIVNFPERLGALDAVILMSNVQRTYFESHGVPPERIHVVLHGVDTNFFRPLRERQEDRELKVLSVGSYRRNFPLLREVCKRLVNEPLVRFKIIAPEPFRKQFADLGNASFMTGLSDDELLEAYQNASCLLLTVESATANNVLLEGMACGLPVVSEQIGGIPEYVNTQCAILARHGSAEELVNGIQTLAASTRVRAEMSFAAEERAKQLNWDHVASTMSRLYEQVYASNLP